MSASIPSPPNASNTATNSAASESAFVVVSPVGSSERIHSIDVLRGFALLGILVMNIQSFAMPMAAYMNPTAYGDLTGVNYWVWKLSQLFADMKFMSIFSMLFGAGIILMTTRTEATGRSSSGVHYRRTFFLFLFGMAHAYLLWIGDILVLYAFCGFWLFSFRKMRGRYQFSMGVVLLPIVTAIMLAGGWWFGNVEHEIARLTSGEHEATTLVQPNEAGGDAGSEPSTSIATKVDVADPIGRFGIPLSEYREQWDRQNAEWRPDEGEIREEIAAKTGSYLDEITHRAPLAAGFEVMMIAFFGWRAASMMLIGMAFYKWGIFSVKKSKAFYSVMAAGGMGIGLPLIWWGVARNEATGWNLVDGMFFNSQFNYYGSVFVAIGWIGLVMLVCKAGVLKWLTMRLAAVGQMSLTNYLLHTIVMTMIFCGRSGWGLGWLGEVERWQQVMLMCGMWVFQLIFSPIWLRYFRFGPFEWLWRSLTYFRFQPMIRGWDVPARTMQPAA